jgi:ABC-type glycerol-3-phosphate transport system permease component
MTMQHVHPLERILRVIALTLVVLFFMFPIVWIFLMSFQTNETILRVPPSVVFSPTLENYTALISGKLQTSAGILEISFMKNLFNSFFLSVTSVAIGLLLGVPAAYAFARLNSVARKTSLSRCCRSALPRHCWYCCHSQSIFSRSVSAILMLALSGSTSLSFCR